jgi:DNA-binding NarL/FixJ family response regulator
MTATGRAFLQNLSPVEREVAAGIAEGLTNRQIAQRRGRVEGTVKNMALKLYRKAGQNNRLGLLIFMIRHGAVNCPCGGSKVGLQ